MEKRIKYIFAIGLISCAVLSACGTGDTQGADDSNGDGNIVYAPVDPATDDSQNKVESTEPEDTANADSTGPDEADDTANSVEAVDTTAPEGDDEPDVNPEDTENDTDEPEENEPTDIPSVDTGVIRFGEEFWNGEHAAGSIVSNENEKIRLVISYDCVMDVDGSVTVAFEVGLESYDINCGARANGGKMYVNGDVQTFSTDEIINEEAGIIYTPFETYVCQIDASDMSCTIGASWFFNGVYAGEKIDTLTADATLDWSANN